jgi:hypothetical protein
MKRRVLLAALAGSTATAASTGCLRGPGSAPRTTSDVGSDTTASTGDGSNDGEPTRTRTDHDGSNRPTETDDARDKGAVDRDWDPAGGPVETFTVGDRDTVAFPDANHPHSLTFWNRVDREREVRFELVDGATEEFETMGPVDVPAGYTVAVDLQVPTRYALAVVVDDASFGTVTVARRWFDCNDSGTSYALGESEVVDYGTASTLVYCTRPSVADSEFAVTSRDCGTEDDERATIAYDGESVRVGGTFVSGSRCSRLSLADASYDEETRTARLVVDADPQDDGGCVNCVGAIAYTATVDFDADLPDHVTIVHCGRHGQERTVATASRNADARHVP